MLRSPHQCSGPENGGEKYRWHHYAFTPCPIASTLGAAPTVMSVWSRTCNSYSKDFFLRSLKQRHSPGLSNSQKTLWARSSKTPTWQTVGSAMPDQRRGKCQSTDNALCVSKPKMANRFQRRRILPRTDSAAAPHAQRNRNRCPHRQRRLAQFAYEVMRFGQCHK